jgi:hypothetical protein
VVARAGTEVRAPAPAAVAADVTVDGALVVTRLSFVGDHGHQHSMMSMPLLPMWLRIGWAVALGAVVLVHIWHAWSRPGQARWRHAGHTLMALGMMAMYLLGHTAHPGLYRVGAMLFGAWTVALVVTAIVLRHREGALNRLWVAATADMLAMTYMLLPTHAAVVSLVFVVYLFCQALAWALGLWTPAVVQPPAPAPAAVSRAVGLTVHDGPAARVSLAVMAASMAYMFAAM